MRLRIFIIAAKSFEGVLSHQYVATNTYLANVCSWSIKGYGQALLVIEQLQLFFMSPSFTETCLLIWLCLSAVYRIRISLLRFEKYCGIIGSETLIGYEYSFSKTALVVRHFRLSSRMTNFNRIHKTVATVPFNEWFRCILTFWGEK